MSYDSEFGKDAWKRYRRMIEAIDPTMQAMLHEFGAEMYQQGLDDAVEAVKAAPTDDYGYVRQSELEDVVAAIEELGEER